MPAARFSQKFFSCNLLQFVITLFQFAIRPERSKLPECGRYMKLGEKIRYLREVEGSLRGLNRAMSQQELVRAIQEETKSKLSQSYLSLLESGARPHMTSKTRQILAGFFKIHPGYLVDDPEGYSPDLISEVKNSENKLDLWLISGAERFRRDPELQQALITLAKHEQTRDCLLLLQTVIETPGLAQRLMEVLRPQKQEQSSDDAEPIEQTSIPEERREKRARKVRTQQ